MDEADSERLWHQGQEDPSDNESAIKIAHNPVHHSDIISFVITSRPKKISPISSPNLSMRKDSVRYGVS